jgi:hypothetical protein
VKLEDIAVQSAQEGLSGETFGTSDDIHIEKVLPS